MFLVETHHVRKSNRHWAEIDELAFQTKILFNKLVFIINEYKHINNTYKTNKGNIYSRASIYHYIKEYPEFRCGMNTKVLKQTLAQVERCFSGYRKAVIEYNKNPSKFLGYPKPPAYKPKDGKNLVIFPKEAISFKKDGSIRLSMLNININTKIEKENIKEVRLVPGVDHYSIEVVYDRHAKTSSSSLQQKWAGADLGVNNLIALSSNDPSVKPVLINGRRIKSINQYYNKHINSLSEKRKSGLAYRRAKRINSLFHEITSFVVKWLISNDITTLVIGKNDGWKQRVDIGAANTQTFKYIPHIHLINQLIYKCELAGISVLLTEESYTSKCSFIDKETLVHNTSYVGRRCHRGLFKSGDGITINADVNGSLNIIRKVAGDLVFDWERVGMYGANPQKHTIGY